MYKGKDFGIDPTGRVGSPDATFCVWYGDEDIYLHSIDEVFTTPFFDGKSLSEILDDIEDIDGCGYGEVIVSDYTGKIKDN